jgi:hypothetical protein
MSFSFSPALSNLSISTGFIKQYAYWFNHHTIGWVKVRDLFARYLVNNHPPIFHTLFKFTDVILFDTANIKIDSAINSYGLGAWSIIRF